MIDIQVQGLLGLIHLGLVIWAIISITGSRESTGGKVLWILLVLVFPILGFLIWLLFGPRGRRRRMG